MKTVGCLIAVMALFSPAIYASQGHGEKVDSVQGVSAMAAAEKGNGSDWHEVIEILGIATFTCLVLTACAGYFVPKKRDLLLKWHRRFAVITIISATAHGIIVLVQS